MNKTKTTRTLKIVVDTKSLSVTDLQEIEQWENEGGRPVSQHMIWKNIAPLRKGEIFEVTGEDIVYEDGQLFLLADLEILALP